MQGPRIWQTKVKDPSGLASHFEKSGRPVVSLKVGRKGLRILLVDMKLLIGSGELGDGRVDAIFGNLWWARGFGWWPGFYVSQTKILEGLLDDLLVLNDG